MVVSSCDYSQVQNFCGQNSPDCWVPDFRVAGPSSINYKLDQHLGSWNNWEGTAFVSHLKWLGLLVCKDKYDIDRSCTSYFILLWVVMEPSGQNISLEEMTPNMLFLIIDG